MEMLSLSTVVLEAMEGGKDPRDLLCSMLHKDPAEASAEFSGSDTELWQLLFNIASAADQRQIQKPKTYLTDLDSVVSLIDNATNIVVLFGAGASSGPDFRSQGGLYDTIEKEGLLSDPYQVFDLDVFREDPSIFWRYAHMIFPSKMPVYSAAHYFVESLESRGKLLRLYTQNVDALERGISDEHLRCVHGSWRESFCESCGRKFNIEDIRPAVELQSIPRCSCGGTIRPGIVFYGQATNLNEYEAYEDAKRADLLIVVGTSLQVAPISELPALMHNVPSILINREPVNCEFNVELLGECSDIIEGIENKLGWEFEKTGEDVLPQFLRPNQLVFQRKEISGTHVVEDGKSKFLVTQALAENNFVF